MSGKTLTAAKKGEAVITAKYKGAEATAAVRVHETATLNGLNDKNVLNFYGRVLSAANSFKIHNTASGFEVNFKGSELSAALTAVGDGYIRVDIDGVRKDNVHIAAGENNVKLADTENGGALGESA